MDRKQRDKKLRQEDILKAAEHVFAVKGYDNSSMADIARQAQYGVGTLYLYFKDKEALYLILIERKFQGLICLLKKSVSAVSGAEDKFKLLVEKQLEYFETNQDFFRIYFSERGKLEWKIKGKVPASVFGSLSGHIDFVSGIVKQAQKQGLIKKGLEPRMLAFVLMGMLNSVIFPWLKYPLGKQRLTDMAGFVLEVFLKGVGKR